MYCIDDRQVAAARLAAPCGTALSSFVSVAVIVLILLSDSLVKSLQQDFIRAYLQTAS
jgi:hypothetical protein